MRRVLALSAALLESAAHLPAGGDHVEITQELAAVLDENVALSAADIAWHVDAFKSRTSQISTALKSVA